MVIAPPHLHILPAIKTKVPRRCRTPKGGYGIPGGDIPSIVAGPSPCPPRPRARSPPSASHVLPAASFTFRITRPHLSPPCCPRPPFPAPSGSTADHARVRPPIVPHRGSLPVGCPCRFALIRSALESPPDRPSARQGPPRARRRHLSTPRSTARHRPFSAPA